MAVGTVNCNSVYMHHVCTSTGIVRVLHTNLSLHGPKVAQTISVEHTSNGIASWILRQSVMSWKQAIMSAKHYHDRWTTLFTQHGTQRYQPSRKGTRSKPRDGKATHHRTPTTNLNRQRQQRSHYHDTTLGLHGERGCEQQTETASTTDDLHYHDNDNQTNNAPMNNARD